MEQIQSRLVKRRQFKATKTFVHLKILARSVQLLSKSDGRLNFTWFKNIFRDLKCKDATLLLKDLTGGQELEVKPAGNSTYEDMGNRTQECELNMVGKPVFHNYLDMLHGAWLRDPIKKDNVTSEKIWLTKETETNNLYEYKNRIDYRQNKLTRTQPYKLACPFKVKKTSGWDSTFQRHIDWTYRATRTLFTTQTFTTSAMTVRKSFATTWNLRGLRVSQSRDPSQFSSIIQSLIYSKQNHWEHQHNSISLHHKVQRHWF